MIVFANAGYYFAFVGANIAAITYLLDSYPARAGPVLVVIGAFRGIVSFGASYGVAKFIDNAGYDRAFGGYAGLTALLGLLATPVFFFGKRSETLLGNGRSRSLQAILPCHIKRKSGKLQDALRAFTDIW